MADGPDPVQAKQRIDEAIEILKALDMPREQQNERSALTLLALADIRPESEWKSASEPLRGITEMMDYFEAHYGKKYAPNTREKIRRQTVHQFLQTALVVINPDDPDRATNSPRSVYQLEHDALMLLRGFGKRGWTKRLERYKDKRGTLRDKYARQREMARIPVTLSSGKRLRLTPGEHNRLVKLIIDRFCSRFTPGAQLLYVGDTGKKFAYFDGTTFAELGVSVDAHGKMPDVVAYYKEKDWLVLIEAVTSHGPIDAKRKEELEALFADCRAGLVYVTAFLDRPAMVKYLSAISWETEVWVADAPTHLIHFNGERFLGPHE